MRYPLIAGEEPTGLQRLLALADSGNGVSWQLELDRWLFVNTDLTVHITRVPTGEWLCLDAVTTIGPDGWPYPGWFARRLEGSGSGYEREGRK